MSIICSLLCIIFVAVILDRPARAALDFRPEEEEQVRILGLRHLGAGLEFRFETENDEDKGFGTTFASDRMSFEERFNLLTQGYIYHPNLLEYRSASSMGLRQDLFDGTAGSSDNNHFLSEYDVSATILKQKAINAHLFATRSSVPVSNQFFDIVTMDTTSLGGLFRYQNAFAPMSLLLRDQSTKEDSLDVDRERRERSAEYRVTNKVGDFLNSEFRYEFKDLVESLPTTQEVITHNLNLNSLLDYKILHGISSISAVHSSGLGDTDTLQLNETFHADHSKTLKSLYGYNFSYSSTEDFQSSTNSGYVGVHHKLYDSLDTEVRAEVSRTSGTDFQELYYGPRFSLSYRKNVPGGLFSAGYEFYYRDTDRESATGIIRVLDERVVLTDFQSTFLANPNVIVSSVVVRDTSHIILRENVDYVLIQRGALTEIRRLALPNNTVVLVDYDFSSPRSLVFDTFGNLFNLRYDFREFLSFYYSYQSIDQNVANQAALAQTTSPVFDTLKSLYGAEAKWRWFRLTGEYEQDSSDLTPFNAWRVRASFDIAPTDNSHLAILAAHSQTDYKNDNRSITFDSIEAYFRLRINTLIDAGLSGGYTAEKGTDIDTTIWRFSGDVRSRFRSLEMKLQPEYLLRHESDRERSEFLLKFSIIRQIDLF